MGFFKRFRKPKAQLDISASKNEWSLGEELKGTLRVTSQEILNIEGINLSLVCKEEKKKIRRYQERVEVETKRKRFNVWENPPDPFSYEDKEPKEYELVWREEEYWDSEALYSDTIQISGKFQIDIGFDQTYPFIIKLPSIGRETYHSIDHNLLWVLSAKMKITRRKNVFSQKYEVVVYQPSVSPQITKEVVREVVLIPCKYCGGLMPQTALFCPNCGARRK